MAPRARLIGAAAFYGRLAPPPQLPQPTDPCHLRQCCHGHASTGQPRPPPTATPSLCREPVGAAGLSGLSVLECQGTPGLLALPQAFRVCASTPTCRSCLESAPDHGTEAGPGKCHAVLWPVTQHGWHCSPNSAALARLCLQLSSLAVTWSGPVGSTQQGQEEAALQVRWKEKQKK